MSTEVIRVSVSEIVEETPHIKKFTLVPIEGNRLPKFSGGSHITTMIKKNEETIERSYSLTADPLITNSYCIAIRRSEQSKGGSTFWHDHVKVGNQLDISYPKNHFMLSFAAKHHILFAAGIGITPFLTMIAELKRKGKTFELHYAARSKEVCAFYDFLVEYYEENVHFYFSSEGNRMSPEQMKGQSIGSHVYFCGPEEMVKEYASKAEEYGYPKKNIHFELFAAKDTGPKKPFIVKLAKSKQEFFISEGENLLDVLLKEQVKAPYSCKVGGCGSCQVEVLSGDVDHRDTFLSEEEKSMNVMMTCVSRAKSNRIEINL
ncbi:PDR/VanB family oxidoreductase [Alkalihalobacillus sp. MEB130]|uniref:PDR/VanB family oxidoreductase n=1 Tax=Alkalihalobacillus sp. MEB130 TaxID=2976704 RepID=UPI0028E09794|nr:PDR/VanB family oxidoreductase [Alkalihalobacillus sp. MEB130]MDT8861346.1 PDR/VanB family oxidoreductase [Alkalihalobacillus sp. MEB130]